MLQTCRFIKEGGNPIRFVTTSKNSSSLVIIIIIIIIIIRNSAKTINNIQKRFT